MPACHSTGRCDQPANPPSTNPRTRAPAKTRAPRLDMFESFVTNRATRESGPGALAQGPFVNAFARLTSAAQPRALAVVSIRTHAAVSLAGCSGMLGGQYEAEIPSPPVSLITGLAQPIVVLIHITFGPSAPTDVRVADPALLMIPTAFIDACGHLVATERRPDFRPAMGIALLKMLGIRRCECASLPTRHEDHVHVEELPATWKPRHHAAHLD